MAVLLASPVVMNPSGFEPYQLPKLTVQALAALVAVTALIAGPGLRPSRTWLWPGALVAVLALAALLSGSPTTALLGSSARRFGVAQWLLLMVVFVVAQHWATSAGRARALSVLSLSSVPVSVLAMLQRAGFDPFDWSAAAMVRPISSVGNATFLGGYLAMAAVASLADAWCRPSARWWRVLPAVLATSSLVLTLARGAWIGAVVGASALILWRLRSATGTWWRLLPVAAAAGAAALVPGVLARAASLSRPTEGTAGGRLELLEMGVRAAARRPLLGWGPDLSRTAMHRTIGADFEARYGDARIEDRAHHVLVDLAVWGGVLAVVVFIGLLVLITRSAWRQRGDWTVVAVGSALVAYAVHWWFNFAVPDLDVVWWLLAGTLAAERATPVRVPMLVVGPVVTVIAAVIGVVATDQLLADHQVGRAVAAEGRADLGTARRHYTDASRVAPTTTTYREIAARYALRSATVAEGVAQARAMVSADSTDPYARELLGQLLAAQGLEGDSAAAGECGPLLRELIAESPYDGSAHLHLGTCLIAQGDHEEGRVEYLRAAALLPRRSEPLRNLGLLAERDGDVEEALGYLERAVAVDPSDEVAVDALQRLVGP
jgi:Flp pilus assembly protein TadD